MDDLLGDFLAETTESLDLVDNQLVQFEQDPNNSQILDNIFRLVHTIKGTCGFLGLPRLESVAHAAENLMDRFRVRERRSPKRQSASFLRRSTESRRSWPTWRRSRKSLKAATAI